MEEFLAPPRTKNTTMGSVCSLYRPWTHEHVFLDDLKKSHGGIPWAWILVHADGQVIVATCL